MRLANGAASADEPKAGDRIEVSNGLHGRSPCFIEISWRRNHMPSANQLQRLRHHHGILRPWTLACRFFLTANNGTALRRAPH